MGEDKKLEPRLLGRYSYLQYRPGIYTLVFVPYIGTTCSIIARNLTFDEVKTLMDEMNGVLDDAYQDFLQSGRCNKDDHE